RMSFLLLGSGLPHIEGELYQIKSLSKNDFNVYLGYNEGLSHKLYAGADFLVMPSRVEPCGLNQMYSMRYGTLPLVRRVGGLKDTVIDYEEKGGYGICFNQAAVGDITHAFWRATELYQKKDKLNALRKRMMTFDFSWESSVKKYLDVYESIRNL
ncbi:MAG: glycogen synthase, partial [Chitinophagaceae bacterium]